MAPEASWAPYSAFLRGSVEDVQFIKKAQLLGLKLDDVRQVLEIAAGGEPPCEHVRAVVANHMAEVERKLRELRGLRSMLKATLVKLDVTPQRATECRCAVIESV